MEMNGTKTGANSSIAVVPSTNGAPKTIQNITGP